MTRSPDVDDRRTILKLAQQGVSVRRIASITKWSRPTISKVLRGEGYDPTTGLIAGGTKEGGGGTDAFPSHIDIEAVAAEAEAEASRDWARWKRGEHLPTYGRPRGLDLS